MKTRPNLNDGWLPYTKDSLVNVGDETYWTHDHSPTSYFKPLYGTGVVTQEAINEGAKRIRNGDTWTTDGLWSHWDNGIGYMKPWNGDINSAKVYYKPSIVSYIPTQEGDREDDI